MRSAPTYLTVDFAGPMRSLSDFVAIQDQQALGPSQDMGAVVEVEEENGPASGVVLRQDPAAALECVCGASHRDPAALAKRGWKAQGGGDAALVVLCSCGAAITAEVVRDASFCDTCRRLVTGSDGDIKVCVVHGGASLVVCAACLRRKREAGPVARVV